MKLVDGKYEPECIAEQEMLNEMRKSQYQHQFMQKLCDWDKEIKDMTSDPNEQIQLKMMLLKSLNK